MAKKKASAGYGCLWWLFIGWWWEIGKVIAKLIANLVRSLCGNGQKATIETSEYSMTYYDVNGNAMTKRQVEEMNEERERQRLEYEQNQHKLMTQYSEMGVAVSLATEETATEDALHIANDLCKARVRPDARPSEFVFAWQPLTKGGKVPKCVLKVSVVWDRRNGDSVIIHIGYLSDMEPYTADVNIWTDGDLTSYKIRVVDGRLAVVGE